MPGFSLKRKNKNKLKQRKKMSRDKPGSLRASNTQNRQLQSMSTAERCTNAATQELRWVRQVGSATHCSWDRFA